MPESFKIPRLAQAGRPGFGPPAPGFRGRRGAGRVPVRGPRQQWNDHCQPSAV